MTQRYKDIIIIERKMEEFIFSSSLVLLFNIIIVLIIIHYGNYIRKETIEQRKSFALFELQL